MNTQKIDFVMLWVDGNDPEWQKQRSEYKSLITKENKSDNGENRFRDWDNLQYWFRGVEKYAGWVNKVYFITNGQKPDWLDLNAERLVFVKHEDYIPAESLPTFNSHAIELNLNKIEGLSDNFVYFNDDTFITDHIEEDMFFRKGVPVHPAELRPILANRDNSLLLAHVYLNMVNIINRNFVMKSSIEANKNKWFSIKNCGFKHCMLNVLLSQYRAFPGFRSFHLPVPIRKSTMDEVWTKEFDFLNSTTNHRFRSSEDVSQFLFRYWDLASGDFEPINGNELGKYYGLGDRNMDTLLDIACSEVEKQKHRMVCINDCFETYDNFELAKKRINSSLNMLFPEKSSFEI